MILLPDVPGVGLFEIRSVLNRFETAGRDTPVRATDEEGRPGTPLVVPIRLIPAFTQLKGDDGGRSILADEQVELVPVGDRRATRDLDTPEDWAEWRAETDTPT